MFIKTAGGARFLLSSVTAIDVCDAAKVALYDAAKRPEQATHAVYIETTGNQYGGAGSHVLGWFLSEEDAQRGLEIVQDMNTIDPLSFATEHAFRFEPRPTPITDAVSLNAEDNHAERVESAFKVLGGFGHEDTTPEIIKQIGSGLSTALGWDTHAIAEVAACALEDANWHTLAEKIRAAIQEDMSWQKD